MNWQVHVTCLATVSCYFPHMDSEPCRIPLKTWELLFNSLDLSALETLI